MENIVTAAQPAIIRIPSPIPKPCNIRKPNETFRSQDMAARITATMSTTRATNFDDTKRTHYVHNAGITIEPIHIHWDSYFADISPVADERAGENDARHTVPQGASSKADGKVAELERH